MSLAIIYSNRNQECERAQALMESLRHEYLVYHLGDEFTEGQFRNEFGDNAPYPQISIGVNHVGTLKDALQYFLAQDVL